MISTSVDLSQSNGALMSFISMISFYEKETHLYECDSAEFNPPETTTEAIHWISVNSLNDQPAIENLLAFMGLDPAFYADIQAPIQQPFDGDDDGCLLVKLPFSERNDDNTEPEKTQIVFVLTANTLLTCTDGSPSFLNRIQRNLSSKRIKLDKQSPDRLFYLLLDGYNDNYYIQLKRYVGRVNRLEKKLLDTRGDEAVLLHILNLRQEMGGFGDDLLVWGEFFNDLKTLGTEYIDPETISRFSNEMGSDMLFYWQEYRSEREDIKELLTIHDLFSSDRMNRTMQLLAVIATIFLPLTFIVGLYGMNLNMPETKWPYMYPYVFWLMMITITLITIVWMKRRSMF